ncbi:GDP-mannose 4,6-dehydratase [bacterium]|nr:GDP-mannose 4,6-dehydratase [bacterium]
MKRALITGIAGQDGSYLAELLLDKGYEVHGLIRRSANFDHPNIQEVKDRVKFHNGDLSDANSIRNLIDNVRPTEIYNLAAQSHVKVSFEMPELTGDTNALGPLRILDSIRSLKMVDDVKFYQASTSEMFGIQKFNPQKEDTPFYPGSPYSAAKLYAYWITVNYRESYKIFGSNGLLFNHESPRRGELFVTRKITKAFANMVLGKQKVLELGNMDSLRDWGHAKDYVRAMWMMLQHDTPDDYVVATGVQSSIRDFCNLTAEHFGIKLLWEGTGVNEVARNSVGGDVMIRVNPEFYRPVDVVNIQGDATKVREVLGWQPQYSLQDLVRDMCENDYNLAKKG